MGVKQPSNIAIRIILFLIGAGLLGWSAWLLFSRLTSVLAVTAIVNGRILTISALNNGQVQFKTDLTSGMAVGAQQALLGVNPVGLNTWMQGVKLDLATEMAKLDAIAAQLTTNRNTAQLESSAAIAQLTVLLSPLVQKVRQAEAALAVARRQADLALATYRKTKELADAGVLSRLSAQEVYNTWLFRQSQIEAALVDLATARSQLMQQRLTIGRLQQVAPLTPANSNLKNLQQQQQDLQVSIRAKQNTIRQVNALTLADQLVVAPQSGVLWEVLVQSGDSVTAGQPLLRLLTCKDLWVDAYVSLSDLDRVQIGSAAEVRLYDNMPALKGRVKTIRSFLYGVTRLGDVAVTPPDLRDRQVAQVRIDLEQPQRLVEGELNQARFCNVGQLVKVTINQQTSPTNATGRR